MVCEAFAAISLAGTIAQFVDFSSKLITGSWKLYHSASGTSAEIDELQVITEYLSHLSETLAVPVTGVSEADGAIRLLARSCSTEAKSLLSVIESLKDKSPKALNGPQRMWQSFHHALKSELKQGQIEEFQTRLGRFQLQLTFHLAKLTSDQQSSVCKELKALMEASTRMNMKTFAQLDQLKDGIEEVRQFIEKDIRGRWMAPAGRSPDRRPDAFEKTVGLVDIGSAMDRLKISIFTYNADDISQLLEKMRVVTEAGTRIVTELDILRSLQFESMRMRQSNIVEAHPKTFEWIFEAPAGVEGEAHSQTWFVDWLRSHNGIYWLSGKPGSGKSTLMKYICNHPDTYDALQYWAGSMELARGSYYFWNAGTEMQKSQQGLLQSLLHEVLRQCPFLIRAVTPRRWNTTPDFRNGARHVSEPWTRDELLEAFDLLVRQKFVRAKFCFFVDGLDEYEGDHTEIIETLNKFTSSPNIKICLSSRPWNVFEDAYGRNPGRKLKLQDLTRNDIKLFVQNKLEKNDRFILLKNIDARYQHLVEEIVNKADGVFLWVYLVVLSLRDGITNADTISTLQRRLRELPSDLESYFRHILDRVDKIYWEGTTQAFQMALAAAGPLPLWTYMILDEEDPEHVIKAEVNPVPPKEVDQMSAILEKRLNARCKGLLEVTLSHSSTDPFSKRNVDFLHRTVRDFLRVRDVQSLLVDRLEKPFDANTTLCKASLLLAKATPWHDYTLEGLLDDCTYYAYAAERITQTPQTAVLDEFARVFYANPREVSGTSKILLHSYVIQSGLVLYVREKLHANPNFLDANRATQLLYDALCPPPTPSKHPIYLNPEMVQILLNHGADPNRKLNSYSDHTWASFLHHIYIAESPSEERRKIWFDVIGILLNKGADPTARIVVSFRRLTVSEVVQSVFPSNEANLLIQSLEQERSRAETLPHHPPEGFQSQPQGELSRRNEEKATSNPERIPDPFERVYPPKDPEAGDVQARLKDKCPKTNVKEASSTLGRILTVFKRCRRRASKSLGYRQNL